MRQLATALLLLLLAANAAQALVQQYHGAAPRYSYFVGCSKGGEEALAITQRYAGLAGDFARVFAVPGMNHCGGGDATDQFDALAALMSWVEHAQPPQRIIARAGAGSPWPGRERPLCPFPGAASYAGKGDREQAASFVCR